MCRWPNGDLSFVYARNKEDAIIMLDEWDNAELAELKQIRSFMVDFTLTKDGDLELQAFGERSLNDVEECAYPLLSQAKIDAPIDDYSDFTPSGKEMIRKAVQAEKQRMKGRKKRKVASTEVGKSLQDQLGAPAVLVDRYVEQAATEILKKSPTSGRKH
jgi:hypothetical protein